MSLRKRYLGLVSRLMPAGALGASLMLGSVAPGLAATPPVDQQPTAASSISERLAAIREAVSAVAPGPQAIADDLNGTQVAQWGNWRNGWRNGGWHNWRNWGNRWHNY